MTVEGWADPRYTAVADTFASLTDAVGRGGAAFCASVGGDVVVDLWCGEADRDRPWQSDTPASLFSATKGMTAACIALLHDRGQLDVDAPVSKYWPEFAAGGKELLTVRQVLSHTTGLTEVPGYRDLMDLDGNGHDNHEEIRRRIASSLPQWEAGTAVGYHVMTYGYIAGTLIELVDGRSLAQFFDDEFGQPLNLDLRIGASDEVLARKAVCLEPDPLPADDPMTPLLEALLATARDESTIAGRACIARDGVGILDRLAQLGNDKRMLRAGVGSGDGVGTARALAEFYGHLVNPRSATGPSAATIASVNEIEFMGPDVVLGIPNAFGVGFGRTFALTFMGQSGPSEPSFGHGGAGGQIGFGDPVRQIGIGFARSHLAHISPLAGALILALYDAADAN